MAEEKFEQEVRLYRLAIIAVAARADPNNSWNNQELLAHFETLSQDDRTHFRQLCARLLGDEQREVRLGTMELLRSYKIRDNILSALLAQIALEQEDLREEALLALWHVGTRYILPQLLLFAEWGYSTALYIIRHMIQTHEEIERGISIARKYIDAKEYPLREAALFLLQKHSSMSEEAKGVLAATQKYKDELFIDALKEAPPELVLESLKELRSAIGANYVENRDLLSTIHVLEKKWESK